MTINNAIDVPQRSTAKFTGKVEQAKAQEKCWIERSLELLRLGKLQKGQLISWAAYHASRHLPVQDPCSIIALLPLFLEKADSPAMVKHGLDILKCITEFLNVGQIPVLACDCPIFAICKKIQWCLPHTHGEDKILIMFGGLHIEKALWNALGSLLSGSGWTGALTEAGIVTSGTADSFLSASHITRTRHIHQVTALSLAKLQQNAFVRRNETSDVHDEKDFKTWREEIIAVSPTYRFWDLILRTELFILMFVRSQREGDFPLYVECLQSLMFLFFALYHYNYSRWVSVHIRDMQSLPADLKEVFCKFWVVQKSYNRFSKIPIDQAHEQENAKVKGNGGVVGLTENPAALCRWLLSGPELARLLTQFKEQYIPETNSETECTHHEEGLSHQTRFHKQVNKLIEEINGLGNPFEDQCLELVVLNTRECADDSVVATVC